MAQNNVNENKLTVVDEVVSLSTADGFKAMESLMATDSPAYVVALQGYVGKLAKTHTIDEQINDIKLSATLGKFVWTKTAVIIANMLKDRPRSEGTEIRKKLMTELNYSKASISQFNKAGILLQSVDKPVITQSMENFIAMYDNKPVSEIICIKELLLIGSFGLGGKNYNIFTGKEVTTKDSKASEKVVYFYTADGCPCKSGDKIAIVDEVDGIERWGVNNGEDNKVPDGKEVFQIKKISL